jgi:hypothetical protein
MKWLANYWEYALVGIAAISLVVTLVANQKPQRKHTCDRVDTKPCQCDETGVCLCEPGFKSCESCKHLQRPDVEAAMNQAKLEEFAERVRSRSYVQTK